MMMTIGVADLAGTDTLAGGLAGAQLQSLIVEKVRGAAPDSLLILDFQQVALVTSSFFLAAFGWLWTSPDISNREIRPVLANLSDSAKEDVLIALEAKRLKALLGEFSDGELRNIHPVNLDEVEQETYRRVAAYGEVTAGDLFRADSKILSSAWSNRLAALFNYRLLRRRKQGRQLIYTLAWR